MLRLIRLSAAALSLLAVLAFAPQRAAARTAIDVPDVAPGASTPVVFVDALQQSTPWSSASPLSLSPEGDVVGLRLGQIATRVVYVPGQSHIAGDYVFLYSGRG